MYRILIVDDEKVERTGLRLLLGKMDQKFEITEAVNGKEALEWLSCNRADILVTDIRMPFVDGLELVEQAARLYPDMKAMIFSGYGEFEYARRAMRFGVEEYILKPVNPTEFQNAIKKILRVLEESKQEKSRKQTEGSLFKEYILNAIFNGTDAAELEKRAAGIYPMDFLDSYRRLMLLEVSGDFFENKSGQLLGGLKIAGLNADYLNVSPQQGILLFKSESDEWKETARRVLEILEEFGGKDAKCYVAVSSSLKNRSQLAERCRETELLMENRFLRSGQPYFHGGIRCGMRGRRAAGRQHTDQADPAGRPDEGYVKPFRACGQAVPQLSTERRIFPDLCEVCLFQPVEGFI